MNNRVRISIFILLWAVCHLTAGSKQIYAHAGGPPYVRLNGIFAQTNPLLNTSAPVTFPVGSDVASSAGYLAGTPVVFEIDTKFFPNPYAQAQSQFGLPVVNQAPVSEPIFQWDFKDGTSKEEGTPVTHVYTKPGTYIIDVAAKFPGKTTEFASVNTVELTVYPELEYRLPKAVITVNGKKIEDPLRDTVSVKPMKQVSFDASGSTGNIVKYQWDFGDQKGTEGKTVRHRYGRDEFFPTVTLRVTDGNNITHDTYALVDLPFLKLNPVASVYFGIVDFLKKLLRQE